MQINSDKNKQAGENCDPVLVNADAESEAELEDTIQENESEAEFQDTIQNDNTVAQE